MRQYLFALFVFLVPAFIIAADTYIFGGNGVTDNTSYDIKDIIRFSNYTCTYAGTVCTLHAEVVAGGLFGDRDFKLGIRASNGTDLIGCTQIKTIANGDPSAIIHIPCTMSVSASTEYNLVAWSENISDAGSIRGDNAGSGAAYYDAETFGTCPDPGTTTLEDASCDLRIWASVDTTGAGPSATQFWDGLLDEVRISNYLRSFYYVDSEATCTLHVEETQ